MNKAPEVLPLITEMLGELPSRGVDRAVMIESLAHCLTAPRWPAGGSLRPWRTPGDRGASWACRPPPSGAVCGTAQAAFGLRHIHPGSGPSRTSTAR